MRAFGRAAYIWTIGAFLLLLPAQFLFAGVGVFGGDFEIHMVVGGFLLHLVLPLLALIFVGMGRLGWGRAGWVFLLFVGITLQIGFVEIGRGAGTEWLSALHVFLAFCWWPYAWFLLWRPVRDAPVAATTGEAPVVEPA